MTLTTSPDLLIERAASLIQAGRPNAARPILRAVEHAYGRQPRLAELSALLNLRAGKHEAARVALDQDLSNWPGHVGLRQLRAELRWLGSDLPGALADAADCVLLAPDSPTAKALLGALLLEMRQAGDAIICLREAVAAQPNNPSFAQALAAAHEAAGNADAAAATLDDAIAASPHNTVLRNAAIVLAVRRYQFARAADLARDTQRAGIADACTFGLQGHALSSLGHHEAASEAYQEALKLGPDDPYVRHLVAASGLVASDTRAPDEYVRAVFDGYADRFDDHLINLGYRGPGQIRAALLRCLPNLADDAGTPIGPVLDIGCGTGLMGVVLSDLNLCHLVGVDLSSRMLDKAREKNLYAELHAAEAQAFLAQQARVFPLAIAADVLCYFGNLQPVLEAVAQRLAPGGLFVFTVERLTPRSIEEPWRLGRSGRFAHDPDYVKACLRTAGLRVRESAQEPLRHEAGAPVPGLLVVTERPA